MSERRDGPERHDAKADPAWIGGRLAWIGSPDDFIRSASPGWWATACQQGATSNTGSPGGEGVGPSTGSPRGVGWAVQDDGGVRSSEEAG